MILRLNDPPRLVPLEWLRGCEADADGFFDNRAMRTCHLPLSTRWSLITDLMFFSTIELSGAVVPSLPDDVAVFWCGYISIWRLLKFIRQNLPKSSTWLVRPHDSSTSRTISFVRTTSAGPTLVNVSCRNPAAPAQGMMARSLGVSFPHWSASVFMRGGVALTGST